MMRNFSITFYVLLLIIHCVSCSAKNAQKVAASDILRKIQNNEDVVYDNIIIDGDLDFTSIIPQHSIHPKIKKNSIQSSLYFTNCTFTGKVIAYKNENEKNYTCIFEKSIVFLNCTFKDECQLNESTFCEGVNFSGSTFSKSTFFEGVQFKGKTNLFTEVHFLGKANFQRVYCLGSLNFFSCSFGGNFSFQNAKVFDILQFNNAQFENYADLTQIKVHDDLHFNYASFNGKSNFNGAAIEGKSTFIHTKFMENVEMENILFYGFVTFAKSTIKKQLDLTNTYFVLGLPEFERTIFDKKQIILENTKCNQYKKLDLSEFK